MPIPTRILSIILGLLAALVLVSEAPAQESLASTGVKNGLMDIEGQWFSCEFAHSQIPPEDDCDMFDDDGFDVSNGRIFHIKVTNSEETGCRHQRRGQCFERHQEGLRVMRDEIGAISATGSGFAVNYWGCTQEYTMKQHAKYFEIAPTGKRCLWTKEKRYFVARYKGELALSKD